MTIQVKRGGKGGGGGGGGYVQPIVHYAPAPGKSRTQTFRQVSAVDTKKYW